MEAGNVNEFIDNLTMQDEMVRYNGNLYLFYGIRFDNDAGEYIASVDRFGKNIYEFEAEIFRYRSTSLSDCLNHLLEDNYWNGKSFWDVEKEMQWVDE